MGNKIKEIQKDIEKYTYENTGYKNIQEALIKLQEIHQHTNYSNMNDMERFTLINDRYEKVFPYRSAKITMNILKYQEIGSQIRANLFEVIKDLNFLGLPGEIAHARKKEYFGYKDFSNEGILVQIRKDIPDDGKLINKIEIINRLCSMGIISDKVAAAFDVNIVFLQRHYFMKSFEGKNVQLKSNSFELWMEDGGIEEINLSWLELKESIFKNIDILANYGEEAVNEINHLFSVLSGEE